MQGNFLQLFKIPETREKVFRTLGLLLCYRLGFHIPIPGMDPGFVADQSRGGLLGLLECVLT